MKLNCDMGEGFGSWQIGDDEAVMPWIDQANIACGFHASDPDIMSKTVKLAVEHNVSIGAHPGYQDKEGFGRRSIPHSLQSIANLIAYQAGALDALCQQYDSRVSYIKPHGALYHDMMMKPDVFEAIVAATSKLEFQPALMVQALADNSIHQKTADKYSVSLLYEAYADRSYDDSGYLVSRSIAGSVYHQPELIYEQVEKLLSGNVISHSGKALPIVADTICVHGDNPESIQQIQHLRKLLSP